MNKKHFSFTDPIYRATIKVYIGDKESVKNLFKKHWGIEYTAEKNHSAESFRVEQEGGYIVYVIWVGSFDWSIDDQATFVHELQHTVTKVLRDRGIPLNQNKDEVQAYYLEYLFKTIWHKLAPRHKKMKRRKK